MMKKFSMKMNGNEKINRFKALAVQRAVSAGNAFKQIARQQIAAVSVLSVLASVVIGVTLTSLNTVVIREGENYQILRTFRKDTSEIMEQAKVSLGSYDALRETENPAFFKDITILRAFPATISCDGETTTYQLTAGTVQTLLDLRGITLGEHDTITDAPGVPLQSGETVEVHRVRYETQATEEAIPFSSERIPSEHIPRGKTKLLTAGKEGVSLTTTKTKYVDGQAVESHMVEQKVLKAPVKETIQVGTGVAVQTSRGQLRSSYYVDMRATAYTFDENGKWGNLTYTGKPVKVGYVAVDPKVIPLGSRLYITYPNGSFAYGYAVAEDTGGSIKGNRIDLFFNTVSECYQFGVRTVRVYVLD